MLKLKLQNFGHLMWKKLTHWKRPWCWERLKAGGKGDDRGWDDWMASPTQWTWVWVSSRSWWWTGKPGVLQSMGLQRVGHDWASELNSGTKPQTIQSCLLPKKFCAHLHTMLSPRGWVFTPQTFIEILSCEKRCDKQKGILWSVTQARFFLSWIL